MSERGNPRHGLLKRLKVFVAIFIHSAGQGKRLISKYMQFIFA